MVLFCKTEPFAVAPPGGTRDAACSSGNGSTSQNMAAAGCWVTELTAIRMIRDGMKAPAVILFSPGTSALEATTAGRMLERRYVHHPAGDQSRRSAPRA